MKVLDEQWVRNTGYPVLVQAEGVAWQVVAPIGFQDEQLGVVDLFGCNKGRGFVVVEGERTEYSDSLSSQNTERGSLVGDIQCTDGHEKTSCGLENISCFPDFRLKRREYLLNQYRNSGSKIDCL